MAFTPEQHTEDVVASYEDAPDARLAEITTSLVRHLHAFVLDVGLTREEWFAGIRFLTETGQISDDERQEFVLLSDTLGISMLVEMINHDGAAGTTDPTVFGPFHADGSPPRGYAASMVDDDLGGEPLVMAGLVRSLDGAPLAGARLDVWQTAPNGRYAVQGGQSEMNLRGIYTTNPDGRYEIRTIRPVAYQIPGDGPAGRLLFDNGRHNWRPAHVHFVVSADGHKPVITHVFDADSDYLDSDAVFGVRPSLVVDMSGGTATFDFVLEPE
jgi:protocatechuate 3,4-dioxygenase beta subunit